MSDTADTEWGGDPRSDALDRVGQDIVGLRSGIEALTEAITLMATKDEVEAAEARQDRKRRLVWVGVVVVSAYIIASTVLLGTFLWRLQDIADQNHQNGDVLVECTTPSTPDEPHECFDNAQSRQGEAIGVLTLGMLDAAICARIGSDEATIQACFETRLADRQAKTGG